jgi:hypothetical protein
VKKFPEAIICLLLFCVCVLVYQINGQLDLASNDNIPHTLLAFNWLENQRLNFDNFRDSYFFLGEAEPPYYFSEAPNGHLTSTYPIGTSIVTFPLYLLFFIYLKLVGFFQAIGGDGSVALDLTNRDFDETRKFFGKLAGTLCSVLSVIFFYLSLRFKFSRAIALLTTFTYAFATTTWVLNSQDLRQHTVSNLLLTGLILCLFKANRTTGRSRRVLLLIAGCFCGLLPSVRLTSAIFSAVAIGYGIYIYRKECIYLLLGLPSILLNWSWNSYYFGLANFSRGGYARQFESGASSYNFSPQHVIEAFFGQLISPGDGLFIFSPVLLFAILGFFVVFRRRTGADETLLLGLSFACLGLFLHYCIYAPWDGGGDSYGPRFLTDILPVACFLVGYALDAITMPGRRRMRPLLFGFLLTLFLSTAVQTVGAFTDTAWGKIPLPLINNPQRRWSLNDSQIERHSRNLIARIAPPIRDPETYIQQLDGDLNQLEIIRRNGTVESAKNRLVARTGAKRVLRASLTNTGQSPWFGYQTGLDDRGETRLKMRLVNAAGKPVRFKQDNLFISGQPQPGESATAIGQVILPKKVGDYRLVFWLTAEGIEENAESKPPIYELNLTVQPRRKKAASDS